MHQVLEYITASDGLQDALSKHPLAAAKQAKYDRQKVFLSGSSAGGNLALSLALLLQKVPVSNPLKVAAIGLQYSGLNLETPYETKRTRLTKPELIMPPPWASRLFLRCYLPNKDLPLKSSKYVSPGLASDDELRTLPPIQLVTAEHDHYRQVCGGCAVLYDLSDTTSQENADLHQRLTGLGIPTKLEILDGVAHAYDVTPTRDLTIREARAKATVTSHDLIAKHFLDYVA